MARVTKNPELRLQMSERLKHVVLDILNLTVEECSKRLGYANSSSLRRALSGKVFVDPEKLFILSTLTNKDGQSANIHWIISGVGSSYLKSADSESHCDKQLMDRINSLSRDKKNALAKFLE